MRRELLINKFHLYYREKGYKKYPTLSLVDESFPTTFIPSAGEPHLLKILKSGKLEQRYNFRVCQPCFRSVDIERVGEDDVHLSFFEMLGSFSFVPLSTVPPNISPNQFFKETQKFVLSSALEFLMNIIGISPERIVVSVFGGDLIPLYNLELEEDMVTLEFLEKKGIANVIKKGYPENYLLHLPRSKEENYLPKKAEIKCSIDINRFSGKRVEIFYDRGSNIPMEDRLVEIATCAFADKYAIFEKGSLVLEDSPYFICYTVYGVERLSMVLEDASSIYEIDSISTLLNFVQRNLGSILPLNWSRKLVDYMRGVVFIVSSGITPEARGRGYILRKLIRKILSYSFVSEIKNPFEILQPLIEKIIEIYKNDYPYVAEQGGKVIKVVQEEKSLFDMTINRGMLKLEKVLLGVHNEQNDIRELLAGDRARELCEKTGLPPELISYLINRWCSEGRDRLCPKNPC
jgi:alanyl-tRNA synthetase